MVKVGDRVRFSTPDGKVIKGDKFSEDLNYIPHIGGVYEVDAPGKHHLLGITGWHLKGFHDDLCVNENTLEVVDPATPLTED